MSLRLSSNAALGHHVALTFMLTLATSCQGASRAASPDARSAEVSSIAPQTTRFVAPIPMAALRCGLLPQYYSLTTKLWVDATRVDLAAVAPNWSLAPASVQLEFELPPLGKDCTELARLYALADDGGELYAKGVRTVRSGTWMGEWWAYGPTNKRQGCYAGFVDRVELRLDETFTISWEWRVPITSWRQPDVEPCNVSPAAAAPAHADDGYVYTMLPSDRALRCDVSGARFRLWLNPQSSNVLLAPAYGAYARMSSVEEFATVAACEAARTAVLQAVKQQQPHEVSLRVPATRKSWIDQSLGKHVPAAYAQEVTCKIAGRTFVLAQRFGLSM